MNEFERFTAQVPVLHAGGVRTPDGSVLLMTGAINAGKSTMTATLVRAGRNYLGDESIGSDAVSAADWLLRHSTSGSTDANRSTSPPSIR